MGRHNIGMDYVGRETIWLEKVIALTQWFLFHDDVWGPLQEVEGQQQRELYQEHPHLHQDQEQEEDRAGGPDKLHQPGL